MSENRGEGKEVEAPSIIIEKRSSNALLMKSTFLPHVDGHLHLLSILRQNSVLRASRPLSDKYRTVLSSYSYNTEPRHA